MSVGESLTVSVGNPLRLLVRESVTVSVGESLTVVGEGIPYGCWWGNPLLLLMGKSLTVVGGRIPYCC